jgi:ATP-dependent Clp protease, protease subunit
MKLRHTLPICFLIASIPFTAANEETPPAATEESATESTADAAKQDDAENAASDDSKEPDEATELSKANRLAATRLTHETNELRAEITRLKMERELISERLALETAKRNEALREAIAPLEAEREQLAREGEIAKQRAEKLTNELKSLQTEAALELTAMQNEIRRIEAIERRAKFADAEPQYLKNPLREDGTLVISDRRIPLNGPVTTELADFVTTRIQFWNNKDRELPIFIVIDSSPGGSVMAGYRILKAMESSDAPIHVVVKSFAASMAAAICTLAEHSYAYPNAVLLHHQISNSIMFARLNLTQQREFYQQTTRWWDRFGVPIAAKMGITADKFIEMMYEKASSGDWVEFADEAHKLKWVNHIVETIEETAILKDPDKTEGAAPAAQLKLEEQLDDEGRPFIWLPRIDPTDVWFLHNPDGYFRAR